jgi:endonuclease/exonuclease/phosphatase (EEP) superfamily protein YafD
VRGRRPWRLAAALVAPVLVGTAVAVPWLHRLVSVPLAVQAVALRGVVAVGAAVAATAVAAAWLALRRPGRRVPTVLAALAAGLAALALTNVAVLGVRGTAGLSGSDPAPVTTADGQLVILALNTQGNLRSTELAPFIAARHADLVMLPETNERTARATAAELADRGLEYQVLVEQLSGGSHPDTALLVGPRVGGTYRVAATGPAASFTASSDAGPPLTAVHTRAPVDLDPAWWSGSTAWAVESCAGRRGAIVAGDFNATLDHVPFRGLGRCVDAAEASGAAGVGTWPSALPRALAAPIDHVLVDGDVWRVLRARVLEPPRGTDHRALEAVIAAR